MGPEPPNAACGESAAAHSVSASALSLADAAVAAPGTPRCHTDAAPAPATSKIAAADPLQPAPGCPRIAFSDWADYVRSEHGLHPGQSPGEFEYLTNKHSRSLTAR